MAPAINRIEKILEILTAYSFNLLYLKDKDMVLSAFLSRMEGDENKPHDIIPISFNIHSILTGKYYTITSNKVETYGVQTRSATKAIGVQMPKVHGIDKAVNPKLKPERAGANRRNA